DQRKRIFAVNIWLLDLTLTSASFFLAYGLRFAIELEGHTVMAVRVYVWLLAIILPIWTILLPLFRVYSELTLPPLDQILRLTKAVGVAWLILAATLYFLRPDAPARGIVFFTLIINYILLVSYRVVLLRLKKHSALDIRHVAVIGNSATATEFAKTIEGHRDWGFKLVGIFGQNEVRALLDSGGIDELIVVADKETLDDFNDTFLLCEELGVTARVILNFFPHSIARMELHQLEGFPLLSFSTTPTNEALLFIRRVMDLVLTLILAPFALIVMGLSAVVINLTSRAPVLFKQERCGLNGRMFVMYKLRSMVDNAEQARSELEALNEMDGPVFKSSRDPRITPVGKILRRFSIDE